MLKAIGSKRNLRDEQEFFSYIEDIVNTEPMDRMRDVIHHGDTTTFEHCLNVAYYNYRLCKRFGLDARAGARGGLMHDLFLYDWHDAALADLHGIRHPKRASENAEYYYGISPLERDIIEKHMFPLTFAFPKHRESFVITLTDKYCGALEVIDYNLRRLNGLFRRKTLKKTGNA